MKRVAIYIRVSTQEQATEGYSINGQRDKLVSYCKLRDWIIDNIYIDGGFSGTNLDRPDLHKLLSNLDNIDIVLVYRLDRLSRSQRDILYLVEEKFLKNNIDFVSIIENFDTTTPFGRAMMGILAVFAQLERETIVERTKLGKERRAKEGYWNGGPAPIGYDLIDGRLIINEYEAFQVKEVFKLYKEYGQNKTAKIMNDIGYKTKYGPWQGRSVARHVVNPIYIGQVKYKDEVFEGVHDAIIDKKEFNEIQSIINRRSKNKAKKSKYLLGGLIWCGHCDARLKSSWSSPGKDKPRFYYYVCYSVSKRPIHMVKDEYCKGKYWKMEDLEKIVINEIKNVKLHKDKFIKEYNLLFKQSKVEFHEKSILEDKLLNIEKQIDKLMDLYQINKIPINTISERIEKLHKEKKVLQERLESIQETAITKKSPISLDKLLSVFENFELIWEEATFEEKRDILHDLVKKIIVKNHEIKIEFNII